MPAAIDIDDPMVGVATQRRRSPASALNYDHGYTVVRWVLGLLLITTAVMKLTGGSGEILRVALPFVSPRIYASGIVFELILGLWLISGLARAWSWLIALLFFGLLGYMSFQLGWFGQASCGCFGKIAVNPWWAFAIDVAAVVALVVWRPIQLMAGLGRGVPTASGAAGILAVAFVAAVWWFGSAGSAWAHLNGELIAVSPAVGDIGTGRVGEVSPLHLTVTNFHDRPVRIVGGTSNCSCIATDDLPIRLLPSETHTVTIRVKYTGSVGDFRRTFLLYTDTDVLKSRPIAVTGRVVN